MRYDDLAAIGVLGVLAERGPETQAVVRDVLKHNFGRYFGFSSGVLGPTFRELEEAGYVVSSVRSVGEGDPPTEADGDGDADADADADTGGEEYAYRVTQAGVERLHDLVADGLRDDDMVDVSRRHHVMVRLGFLHHLPARRQAGVLASVADGLRSERERWQDVRRAHGEADTDRTGYRGDLVRLNVRMLDTFIDWVEDLEIHTYEAVAVESAAEE